MTDNEFSYVDYTVFALSLLLYGFTGIFYAYRSRNSSTTSREYFEGNRKLAIVPTAISLFASFTSAIALVAVPGEIYTIGGKYMWNAIGSTASAFITAAFIIPAMFRMNIVSVFEYLEIRYKSKSIRVLGSILAFISQLVYMSNAVFAPCTALKALTGCPELISMFCTIFLAAFYTSLGGLSAVILVDFIQAIIMLGGIVTMTGIAIVHVGGFESMFSIANEGGRLNFFAMNDHIIFAGSGFLTIGIGTFFDMFYWWAFTQTAFQRYHSVDRMRNAQTMMYAAGGVTIVFNLILLLTAIALYAYYTMIECDPLASGQISNANQLMPQFLLDVMNYPPIPGVYIAALFSGCFSTLSSGYNAMAVLIWEDYIKSYVVKLSPRKASYSMKGLVVVISVISFAVACMLRSAGGSGTVIQLMFTFNGLFEGVQVGLFLFGLLVPFAEKVGVMCGMLMGTGVTLWIAGGQVIYGMSGQERLPTSVDGCCKLNDSCIANTSLLVTTTISHSSDVFELSGVDLIYSMSYYMFPVASFLIFSLFALPISALVTFNLGKCQRTSDPGEEEEEAMPLLCSSCCPTSSSPVQSYKTTEDNAQFELLLSATKPPSIYRSDGSSNSGSNDLIIQDAESN